VSVVGDPPVLSVMLAVADATSAAEWYRRALGATTLWDLGGVVGLHLQGAPFFLGEPENNGWESPLELGITSTRVEVFVDDPDALVTRAVAAGAERRGAVRVHQMPWGPHLQGGFTDPFGHIWFVGDRSPLRHYRGELGPADDDGERG
jgi:PhnB protein